MKKRSLSALTRRLKRARALVRVYYRIWRGFEFFLAQRFGIATREDRVFALLIPVTGVIAGYCGVGIGFLIRKMGQFFNFLASLSTLNFPIYTELAIGGLVIATLYFFIGKVNGKGISLLIESIFLRKGIVPSGITFKNIVYSIVTVSAGGSVGKEGPMISFGGFVSSYLGWKLGLSYRKLQILLACGAASGLAAAYNIPVGSALFTMEVILGNFALHFLGPVVVSSVISTLIARAYKRETPIYFAPDYHLSSGWELLFFIILGAFAAMAGYFFNFSVRYGRRTLVKIIPYQPLRSVGYFLMLGLLGFWIPEILGGGFQETFILVRGEESDIARLSLLFIAKVIAVVLTLAGGGVGGMFTPSLFIGAVIGTLFGLVLELLFPGIISSSGVYSVVGMAGILSASMYAPLSAVIILFEFTGNYNLILALMITSVSAAFFTKVIGFKPFYLQLLEEKGVNLNWRFEEIALAGVKAKDLVREDRSVVKATSFLKEVVDRFISYHRRRIFVVDEDGNLIGEILLQDIKKFLADNINIAVVIAYDIMHPRCECVHLNDTLDKVVELFARIPYENVPVVDSNRKFVGVITKRDLMALYVQEVLDRPAMLATILSPGENNKNYLELPEGTVLEVVEPPPTFFGKSLATLDIGRRWGIRILFIKRISSGKIKNVLPSGRTIIQEGDELIVVGPPKAIEQLKMLNQNGLQKQ